MKNHKNVYFELRVFSNWTTDSFCHNHVSTLFVLRPTTKTTLQLVFSFKHWISLNKPGLHLPSVLRIANLEKEINMLSNSSLLLHNSRNRSSGIIEATDNSTQDCIAHATLEGTVLKAVAYFVILIVSLVGNGFILLVIYKNKRLRRNINYFVLNMAVSDLFFPITIMPIEIVEIISGSKSWKVDSPWILGNILCKLSYFLPDVSLVVSIESLVLISVDRFVAVVFPLKARRFTTKVHLISILCTWIIAIAVHAPYFYTFRLIMDSDNKTYCKSNWGPAFDHVETHKKYVTATFITFVLVPITILAITYGTIAWALRAESKKMERESCNPATKLNEQSSKIIRSSVAIITAFAFCMIPQLVSMLTRVFVWDWQLPPICAFRKVVPFIATFMLNAWSAVNPFICFIFIKSYQDTLKRVLCSRCLPEHNLKNLDLTTHPGWSTKLERCRSTRV